MAEIEKRKDAEQDEERAFNDAMESDHISRGKVLFKKQTNASERRKPSFNASVTLRKELDSKNDSDDFGEKAILKGSKVVMPEYVIGQKLANKTKKRSNTQTDADSRKSNDHKPHLQHLFDEEDEIQE